MVSVLTKIKRIKLMTVLLMMVVSILCAGCDGLAGHYPYDKSTEWVCSDPNFTITYTHLPKNGLEEESFLEVDGKMIAVHVAFRHGSNFTIKPINTLYPAGPVHYSERLLTGLWKYRDGNLILTIQEDFVFDNQYEEFVFCPGDGD